MTLQQANRRRGSLGIALIFLGTIFLLASVSLLQESSRISMTEKRYLASPPKLPRSSEEVARYPARFDKYFSDNFGLRDWLAQAYRVGKYRLGDSPSPMVTLGKQGWLFLGSVRRGGDQSLDPMGDARHLNLYTADELAALAQHMSELNAWLIGRGSQYLFVLTPGKHTTYAEYLPDYIEQASPLSAADQLMAYLEEHTDIEILDLRQAVSAGKLERQLFFKTDTHWNAHGANLAQHLILRKVESMFPGNELAELRPIDESQRRSGGDLANYISPQLFTEVDPRPMFRSTDCEPRVLPQGANYWEPHTTMCDSGALNAVIFRDSFFFALEPFVSRKFRRASYIWARITFGALEPWIDREQPDIVIEQWAERALPFVPEQGSITNP